MNKATQLMLMYLLGSADESLTDAVKDAVEDVILEVEASERVIVFAERLEEEATDEVLAHWCDKYANGLGAWVYDVARDALGEVDWNLVAERCLAYHRKGVEG